MKEITTEKLVAFCKHGLLGMLVYLILALAVTGILALLMHLHYWGPTGADLLENTTLVALIAAVFPALWITKLIVRSWKADNKSTLNG